MDEPLFSSDGDPIWLSRGRIPSLDGLRAVSILMVLWQHLVLQNLSWWPSWVVRTKEIGSIGVDVFFVISGFLITLLMVRERTRTGRVSIRAFYLRRCLRIVPAYLAYALVVGGALALTSWHFSAAQWARVLTYTMSLHLLDHWYLDHFWSLSVEEHFYLIWPLLFVCLSRRRVLFVLCVGYTLLAILLRVFIYARLSTWVDARFFTLTRADAIASGCALALVATSRYRAWLIVGPARAMSIALVAAVVLLPGNAIAQASSNRWMILYTHVGYRFVVEWCVVAMLWASVYHANSIAGRILNSRPLVAVGVLSYSIYLWQQPFFGPLRPMWIFAFPGNLVMILVVATASYRFIERPFLRAKVRHEVTPEGRRRSEVEAEGLAAARE